MRFSSFLGGESLRCYDESFSRSTLSHAGFGKVGPELCKAGTDSKQFEELTSCSPGGKDSPKLRTASARSGETYFDKSAMVSSENPSAIKREMA